MKTTAIICCLVMAVVLLCQVHDTVSTPLVAAEVLERIRNRRGVCRDYQSFMNGDCKIESDGMVKASKNKSRIESDGMVKASKNKNKKNNGDTEAAEESDDGDFGSNVVIVGDNNTL